MLKLFIPFRKLRAAISNIALIAQLFFNLLLEMDSSAQKYLKREVLVMIVAPQDHYLH